MLYIILHFGYSTLNWEPAISPTNVPLVRPPVRVLVGVRGGWTNGQLVGLMGGRTDAMPFNHSSLV